MRPGFLPLLRMVVKRAVEEGLKEMSWPMVRVPGRGGEGSWFSVCGMGRRPPTFVRPFLLSTE